MRPRPKLTDAAKKKRVEWAKKYQDLDFRRVIFTDSKIFTGSLTASQAKKMMMWAPKGQVKAIEVNKYAPYQVHVYGGISVHGATSLHIATGTTGVTSQFTHEKGRYKGAPYKGVCSKEYIKSLVDGGVGATMGLLEDAKSVFEGQGVSDWLHQHDCPNIHVAAQEIINQLCPGRLDWHRNSPDLSLIENVWSMVEYQIRRAHTWHDLESFKAAIVMAWESVTSCEETRQTLFNSMPGRVEQCIHTYFKLALVK